MSLSLPVRTSHPLLLFWLLLLAAACSDGRRSSEPPSPNRGDAELVAVHYGLVADVFGLVRDGTALEPRLFVESALIGPDIRDELLEGRIGAGEPRYDFLTPDEDTLQPQLLILREVGTEEFDEAFAALAANAPLLTPHKATDPNATFSVVPRNAGLRLRFSIELGIDQSFFTTFDGSGMASSVRNAEAVQLLELGGTRETMRPVPIRVTVRGRDLIIDPVLLGRETRVWNGPPAAAGMPPSPNQRGANLRVALPMTGPLAIPGLREDRFENLVDIDQFGAMAIVRDFRSGNRDDNSPWLSRGFVRDATRPQLLGRLPMRLAAARPIRATVAELELYKNGIVHEIDRGDALRLSAGESSVRTEVLLDPSEDRFRPDRQYVRVRVRNTAGLLDLDPRGRPDYPTDPSEVEGWLAERGPVATLTAPYQASRRDPATGDVSRDDPRWFVEFQPEGLDPEAQLPTEDVRVFAGAVLRFSKPMDMDSLKPLDTMFFATRDVASPDALEAARQELGIPEAAFEPAKFRTPHRIGSLRYDSNGTQTIIRLQPMMGFYLDDTMRAAAAAGQPFEELLLHILTGPDGVNDLAGQPLEIEAAEPAFAQAVVVPFELDARVVGGNPVQPDNLVVYSCSSFELPDEDERPSYYLPEEVLDPQNPTPAQRSVPDLFGNHVLLDGRLHGRPTLRTRRVADNQNQGAAPAQNTIFRWCYEAAAPPPTTASTLFAQGIQNPFNPFGSRTQMCWREIDLSLSRTGQEDMDLDVERMFWAPLSTGIVTFDVFDSTSLFLGHSEQRPVPCVGNFSALPNLPDSGLTADFQRNYVWNPARDGSYYESSPSAHAAYVGQPMTISAAFAVREPAGVNRFLPLPEFRQPYFVFRDQTVEEQGGELGQLPTDVTDTIAQRQLMRPPFTPDGTWAPYILSPWLAGRGDDVQAGPGGTLEFVPGVWNNGSNRNLQSRNQRDPATGGLLGSIALPLLADFQVLCDDPLQPLHDPFRALGVNGWQVALTVQSDPMPAFRAFSGGRPDLGSGELCVRPGTTPWGTASGGFDLNGAPTRARDNSLYWVMIDFLKRQTVTTAGFVDLQDPHRVPAAFPDPRLRPQIPPGRVPEFTWAVVPAAQPAGTELVVEFRAAGAVDPEPWQWREDNLLANQNIYSRPDERNVPLDPRKATDAHIRKFDDRGGWNSWTHFYHRVVTDYVEDPNTLMTNAFAQQYGSPGAPFSPDQIRYLNWRIRMSNAVEAAPPVSPSIDALLLAWRY